MQQRSPGGDEIMEQQRDENSDGGARNLRRKPYTSPELQEWGSIQDLTRGGNTIGETDFPAKGGSEPV